uniref:Putative secreted protein n=1 Tax=Anopheles marajoara TaxID=58244 RepID=A0A2M4CAT2_9DIPT
METSPPGPVGSVLFAFCGAWGKESHEGLASRRFSSHCAIDFAPFFAQNLMPFERSNCELRIGSCIKRYAKQQQHQLQLVDRRIEPQGVILK